MNNLKGYGFRPSDEELIGYLRDRTLLGCDYLVQDIIDLGVDICNFEPWDLRGCSSVTSSDPVWYFIYPITYKYSNNSSKVIDTATGKGPNRKRKPMINRATNDGKWKVSGEPIKVRASDSKEEIGCKTRLYFYTGRANNENNKKSKAKQQNSYPNKTPWVLYEYELIDVDPNQNKYFLGKLMMKQSKPTNISISKGETSQQLPSNYLGNDHILTREVVQPGFHQEPLIEIEVPNDYNSIQNQTSISEQTNEFINSLPVVNYETYPEERSNQENFVNDGNEVISNLQPSNLVADYATPQVVQLNFHQQPLIEMEIPNDYDWIQNQTCISEQTTEFINSFPVVNYETYAEERSNQENVVNDGNEVISNLQPSNIVADYAIPQNLQVDYMELIKNQEVPNVGIGAQNQLYTNQHDHSFQNVLIDNYQTYPEERSNQHNIVAENEGFNLPSNFYNNSIADICQMNWYDFDDLCRADGLYFHELFGVPEAALNNYDGIYLHELFGVPEALNNYDGVQNQYGINQQVADEFRNSNLMDNEIDQPDERNKSAAAAEIEGSNLPSLGMTESSYPMESIRKRSGMELEGSSIGIETEVAQPQAKKSRS